mmetsp:Transcript_21959/g.62974  ORF Transcript_21959/g.62974 Transcript_21959/m.62974 type:complete len:616 (+) Transcript_21959:17-1864(+)
MADDLEVMDDVNLPGGGAAEKPDTFTSDPVIDIDPVPAANGHTATNLEGHANGEENGGPTRPPPRSLDSMEMLSLPKKQSGLFGASSNLVNSIVGAGIVGIPYAFRQAGFVAGLVLLGLVAFLTDRSLRVIINLATYHPKLKNRNVLTFESLASYPFGKVGKAFILVNMFIMAYGAMVAYLIIIKDTVPTILGVSDGNFKREIVLIIFSLVIMVPLSMQRDMASLSVWSFISVLADVILVGFVAAFAPIKETVSDAGGFGAVLGSNWINPTLFVGLGVLSTAMACQHSAFIVSGSIRNHTSTRWKIVTVSSISFATILCAIMGFCGFLGFLDETQGNILNNFDPGSVAANGARTLLAITMFFTYPMESFVARHVFVMLVHQGDMDAAHADGGRDGGGFLCLNRRRLWTLGIYFLALIPALFLNDLGPVLSITGSLGGSCISYIAPGMVYFGVNGDAFLAMCSRIISNHASKQTKKDGAGNGTIELPVAGDADQKIADEGQASELPVEGEHRTMVTDASLSGPKPLWWYFGLFPIWCAIARRGSKGMQLKMEKVEEDRENAHEHDGVDVIANDADYQPSSGGFCMAIFFIIFGIIGVVAGITSNVIVQYEAAHSSY